MESFMAGSITGAMSCCLFQPLDLIKTRIQAPIQQKSLHNMTSSEVALLANSVKPDIKYAFIDFEF